MHGIKIEVYFWLQSSLIPPPFLLLTCSISSNVPRLYPSPFLVETRSRLQDVSRHCLTFLACLTRFSITPSNASRSPIFSSVRLVQKFSTSLAASCSSASLLT